jgi:hypothetical protein
LIAQPIKGALDQSGQSICGAIDGLVYGCGMVSDRNGLPAFEARFHYAALVV